MNNNHFLNYKFDISLQKNQIPELLLGQIDNYKLKKYHHNCPVMFDNWLFLIPEVIMLTVH